MNFKQLLFASVCLLFASKTVFAASQEQHQFNTLELSEGGAEVIKYEQPVKRVAVTNPRVVEARVIGDAQILLIALAEGSSEVVWWLENGVQLHTEVMVVPRINTVLAQQLQAYQNQEHELTVDWRAGHAWLSGSVSTGTYTQLQILAEQHSNVHLHQLSHQEKVKATLELEVKVYEINRRSLQKLGMRWQQSAAGPVMGVLSDWRGGGQFRAVAEQGFASVPGQEALLGTLSPGNYGYLGIASSLSSTLQLLQERGEGRVLATPKLRVESGEVAEFLAGGEIPIPQITLQGATEVQFKNYGVYLQVEPVMLADGRIRTKVITELSQPDFAVAVQGVPGLKTRRAETIVSVTAGETLIIAGLVNQESSQLGSTLPGTPGYLSRVLGYREQQQQETELVVFITPRNLYVSEKIAAERAHIEQSLWQQFNGLGCNGMLEGNWYEH